MVEHETSSDSPLQRFRSRVNEIKSQSRMNIAEDHSKGEQGQDTWLFDENDPEMVAEAEKRFQEDLASNPDMTPTSLDDPTSEEVA